MRNFLERVSPCEVGKVFEIDNESAWCTAVKKGLCGNFIQRGLLRLQIGAALIKAGNDDKNDSGSKH